MKKPVPEVLNWPFDTFLDHIYNIIPMQARYHSIRSVRLYFTVYGRRQKGHGTSKVTFPIKEIKSEEWWRYIIHTRIQWVWGVVRKKWIYRYFDKKDMWGIPTYIHTICKKGVTLTARDFVVGLIRPIIPESFPVCIHMQQWINPHCSSESGHL